MSTKKQDTIAAILTIAESAGVTLDELIEYAESAHVDNEPTPKINPVQVLREGLARAKEITGMEYDDIGRIVGGVTGGAVGHWARGRTRPNKANRIALYRWITSVEDALGKDLLPEGFTLKDAEEADYPSSSARV